MFNTDVMFNIIINTDIEDLYTLYTTNKFIQSLLNEKYTLFSLAKKHNIDQNDFIDILFEYYVNKINILTNFHYKNTLSDVSKLLKIKLLHYYRLEDDVKNIKIPMSAYKIFIATQIKLLRNKNCTSHNFNKIIHDLAVTWRNMDTDSKRPYKENEIKEVFRYAKSLKN